MHVWAITGGIACGKSTVSRLFAEQGAQIASADDDARAVLTDGSGTREAVLAAFGTLDRAALGKRVFEDPEARKTLNALMHPAIRRRMRATIDAARAEDRLGLLLYEVPLLYEGGLETWFDGVIAVQASHESQRSRLLARGLSEIEAEQRLAAQLDPLEKVRRSQQVVSTDIPIEETRAAVAIAYSQILAGKSADPPIN